MSRHSKTFNQRHHAKVRAGERYGIDYSRRVRGMILDTIQRGGSSFTVRQSRRVTIHDLTVEDIPIRVAYDRLRHEIITFLPLQIAAPNQKGTNECPERPATTTTGPPPPHGDVSRITV